MKTKSYEYYCKYCGAVEIWPKEEYQKIITTIYCPICATKNYRRKMLKVKEKI